MILDKTLQQIGLTDKEALVYLATLELGKASVLSIARKAELKRPTVYVTLEGLTKRGLVRRIPKGTTTHYVAEDPTYLLSLLRDHEQKLETIMPLLRAMHNASDAKPAIKFYEGKEGVAQAYQEYRKAKRHIVFYGSIKSIVENFPESFMDASEIKKMKIPVTEIVSADREDIAYAKQVIDAKNPLHKIRKLKKGIKLILDSAVFDDNLLIVSLKGNFFAVMIQNRDIAQSFKQLYELAWEAAEPI